MSVATYCYKTPYGYMTPNLVETQPTEYPIKWPLTKRQHEYINWGLTITDDGEVLYIHAGLHPRARTYPIEYLSSLRTVIELNQEIESILGFSAESLDEYLDMALEEYTFLDGELVDKDKYTNPETQAIVREV
mgnify:CR=1 FL=1